MILKAFSEYQPLVLKELKRLVLDDKTQAVAQKFVEDMRYLFATFDEVYFAEGEYIDYQNDCDSQPIFEDANSGISSRKTLDEIQHQFVVRNQSYFLRVYVTAHPLAAG